MKKKLLALSGIVLVTVSLTSCSYLFDLFSQTMDIVDQGDGPVTASSRKPISDISTPPADEATPIRANHTYSDLVDNSVHPISCTPSLGSTKLLVIPVWFNDSSSFISESKKENVRSDIQSAYFGSNEEVGWRSVKSYYEEESQGLLKINGSVSEWYEVNRNHSYYRQDDADDYSPAPKTCELAVAATDWYFNNHKSEKKTDYDSDGDGYLDGIMLIYAAPDFTALDNDDYDNLWAFCCWVQDYDKQNPANPAVNAFFWASYDFMYGKEVIETRAGIKGTSRLHYYSGDTSKCKIDTHTYIHEMGHMFGLEDYYDYSSHGYKPAGAFSMQDHNVGGHDPFSSFALGWGKAYIPRSTMNIDLKPFATSGEMILLSPNWNEYNSPFDEYLLLEYYTDEGLNEFDTTYKYLSQYGKDYPIGTKEYGIRLWHVDARLLYTNDGDLSPSKVTTNPKILNNRVLLMMSNTYYDSAYDEEDQGYLTYLGKDYANYNVLQLIRNSSTIGYKPTDNFSSSSLFKAGDTFSMSKYSRQFVNSTKLNSKNDLGFAFSVNACNNGYASITVTKL